MRMEQQAVPPKIRRPPNGVTTDSNSTEVSKSVVQEKGLLSLSKSAPGERRSFLGWSRPAVSKAAVSKINGTTQPNGAAELDEKSSGTTFISMQADRDANRQARRRLSESQANNDGTDTPVATGEEAFAPCTNEAANGILIHVPVIHIDKPLPASPEPVSSSPRSQSPTPSAETVLPATSKDLPQTPSEPALQPSFRRIKSYGDLLSSSASSSPRIVGRRASHNELKIQNAVNLLHKSEAGQKHDPCLQPEGLNSFSPTDRLSPASPVTTLPGPFKGSLLKKRSSSLGMSRRPSAMSTETIKAAAGPTPAPDISQSTRNFSSATAPASMHAETLSPDLDRKRKTSVFNGLFSGLWKSKTKDASTSPLQPSPAAATDSSSEETSQVFSKDTHAGKPPIHGRKRTSSSASTNSSILGHGPVTQGEDEVLQTANIRKDAGKPPLVPPTVTQHRRYSIIHSLFRSVPSSHAPKNEGAEATTLQSPPVSSSSSSEGYLPTTSHAPIDIPHSSLPQLPDLSRDLGDISFGSLFDNDGRGSRSRSRASTRGSLQSLFSSSPRAPTPPRTQSDDSPSISPRLGSTRSRSNSQLQQSITASDIAEGKMDVPIDSGSDIHFSVPEGGSRLRDNARPKSPVVDKILQEDRRYRTRLFRSNSTSSVSSSLCNPASTTWPKPEIRSSRPSYGRSRSSSTISNSTTTRILPALPEIGIPGPHAFNSSEKPAITVTSDSRAPSFPTAADNPDGYGARSDSPVDMLYDNQCRASRSSSMSTGGTSPALLQPNFFSSPQHLPEADANLADAISDFVLSPPAASMMRVSADSHVSDRSSLSAASSLLSSSPASSSFGGPSGSRASSIIQKTLRRRANTMGPLLPVTSANGNQASGTGKTATSSSFDDGDASDRPGRSSSSSRLPTFFGTPSSALSRSPNDSSTFWLRPHEPSSAPDLDVPPIPERRSIVRRLSSSLLGSPKPSLQDTWSNSSSPRLGYDTLGITSYEAQEEPAAGVGGVGGSSTQSTLKRTRSHSQTKPIAQSNTKVGVMPDDTPVTFLARVKQMANSQDVVSLLSSKYISRSIRICRAYADLPSYRADSFHSAALRLYFAEFDFVNDAIDLAVRKLLLKLHLPRETQQIDRTMEAFAERYYNCNPALFLSPDQPYILAFSIIMLHTDAYNKSNKNKMTRADYVKNTKVDGLSTVLLEVRSTLSVQRHGG